ncbi:MAG: hypothetical protein E7356_04110 [Clostridiales bacterium]|nr:hypothetical protein [Clostridiales bacterium]
MLSRKEKMIMQYILKSSGNKDTCLLSPLDIEHACAPKFNITQIEAQALLDGLVQENYINLVNSDKNGELIYCISILPKGKSFHREQHNVKKVWVGAVVRTVLLAVLSFVVTLVLKLIFF